MFLLTGAGSLLASCFGACAMTACCTGTKELMKRSARMAYCLLFVLSMLLAWVLRDFAKPLMEKIPWIVSQGFPELPEEWYGKQAVYRVSMGNFLVVESYGWAARFGAGAFLVVQMLILLDFTATLNDSWVEADDERYLYLLLAATIGSYITVLAATVA
eukprot:scaffold252805_cov45-Prasinocladus_malaysianus.AAC.1